MQTLKLATVETLGTLLRNRYVLCALVVLGTVGPGMVKLASMLERLQH